MPRMPTSQTTVSQQPPISSAPSPAITQGHVLSITASSKFPVQRPTDRPTDLVFISTSSPPVAIGAGDEIVVRWIEVPEHSAFGFQKLRVVNVHPSPWSNYMTFSLCDHAGRLSYITMPSNLSRLSFFTSLLWFFSICGAADTIDDSPLPW
ncbi:hypothetical protein Hypma_002451 [Hypsizygus marmoreus]|uniref:Uncharacterized protein n=1 Tax=Hypsizygus marmoreus TaxID=39966 RepID=A0A369J3V4_HYPMA|nr:hypothetical protein Hypma_002451 [Hypsizygus marmoreus]